mgnify:CR=1 FL=1
MNKEELFERMPISQAAIKLGLPTVLSSLVMVAYNLADTWFVGYLNDPVQNAAVTFAAPVLLAFNAVNNLFGVGVSSAMSRALGMKDYDTVRKSSSFGFYFSIFSGLLFSLVYILFQSSYLKVLGAFAENAVATADYMFWTVALGAAPSILNVVISSMVRAEGGAFHASVGVMSGCVLNIILDPFFILPFGLNMGVAGAGLATFISNCAACIYYLIYIYKKKDQTFVCINPGMMLPGRKNVMDICSVGIPASIQNLLNVTGMAILNNFTAAYGSNAVAAMGISHKLHIIPVHVVFGMFQGIMPLIGYNYASGNIRRVKDVVRFSMVYGISTISIITAIFYYYSSQLTGLFIDNALVIAYGSSFLKGMVLAMPFLCMDFLAVAMFQSCGKGTLSFVFAVLRKIILEIPAILFLDKLFPLYGLAYSQLVTEIVMAIIAFYSIQQFFKRIREKTLLQK